MSHPFELPTVTVEQVPLQLVVIVVSWLAARLTVSVGIPLHESVTVAVEAPPLKACTLTSWRGLTKRTVALRAVLPLNEMLLVVNLPQGFDRNHWLVPQSATPDGYWPLSGRPVLERSSNVMV